MRTRDKYDIFLDILKAAGLRSMGSTIVEVTKKASLNPEQAKEVIIDMLEIGLLEFNKENFENNNQGMAIRKNLREFKRIYTIFVQAKSFVCWCNLARLQNGRHLPWTA